MLSGEWGWERVEKRDLEKLVDKIQVPGLNNAIKSTRERPNVLGEVWKYGRKNAR